MANLFDRFSPAEIALAGTAGALVLINAALLGALIDRDGLSPAAMRLAPPAAGFDANPADISALADRPLFSASRRPAPPPASASAAPRAPAARATRLTPKGTRISASGRSVVMESAEGPVVIREGETRHGVKVIRVGTDEVELEANGARRTVDLAPN